MVDLTRKPFCLDAEQLRWVEETLGAMTLEEKLGQLFVILKTVPGVDEQRIQNDLNAWHQGGLRWQGGNKEQVWLQNTTYQKHSKIPLLIAANCDEGGNSVVPEGSFVATAAECGAGQDSENAYHVGLVSGREASAVGCNWMFNPVCDLYLNWRNTIVNTRSFGAEPERVIEQASAYIRGIRDANPHMACTAKHFPGDGVEELDQHLVMGVNGLSVEAWESSFGKVYRALIEDGIEAVMVGHIALPEMSRKLRPGIRDEEIMPATLAPELLNDLLRQELGFNGLVITDASHMVGIAGKAKRRDSVPGAIAAGCDMFLFTNDADEDIGYLRAAYEDGRLSEERLDDALHRVLGLKAKLHLYEENVRFPDKALLDQIGCEEHRRYSVEAAESCITLVKDTRKLLPVKPEEKRGVFLVYESGTPNSRGYQGDPVKKLLIEELERAGYQVDVCPNYYDLELENGVTPMNFLKMCAIGKREDFIAQHDFALVVVNFRGYAQENCVRLRWSCSHSGEIPWYNEEIPTIGVSLNYTNHLIDLPMLHTFINAYGCDRAHIRAMVEKLSGKSGFCGQAEETVFCGRWDTRL